MFSPGDKVVCVRTNNQLLCVGTHYTIQRSFDYDGEPFVSIVEIPGSNNPGAGFFANRFRLAEHSVTDFED